MHTTLNMNKSWKWRNWKERGEGGGGGDEGWWCTSDSLWLGHPQVGQGGSEDRPRQPCPLQHTTASVNTLVSRISSSPSLQNPIFALCDVLIPLPLSALTPLWLSPSSYLVFTSLHSYLVLLVQHCNFTIHVYPFCSSITTANVDTMLLTTSASADTPVSISPSPSLLPKLQYSSVYFILLITAHRHCLSVWNLAHAVQQHSEHQQPSVLEPCHSRFISCFGLHPEQ